MKLSAQQTFRIVPVLIFFLVLGGTLNSDYETIKKDMFREIDSRFEAFTGMVEQEELDEERARDLVLKFSTILAFLYPAFIILELMLLSGGILLLISLVERTRGRKRKYLNLSELSFPFFYVWILIFATGASLLSSISGSEIQFRLWLNYLLLLGVGFFLQGLAVLRFVAVRLKISPIFQTAVLTIGILVFFQAFAPLVTATGFADIFLDLRRRFILSRND